MKPAPFEFHRAQSAQDAIDALRQGLGAGLETKVIAGGQSLVALMNMRLARPQLLIDLNRVGDLSYIDAGSTELRVGAMARQRTIEMSEDVRRRWPLLSEALPYVAHTPIRSRGTLGGSLAHADPGAELCAVGLALDASVKVLGAGGERQVGLDEFFLGPFTTSLEPDEIVTEISFPSPPTDRVGWAFEEVARRKGDFALAGVAAQVHCGPDRTVRHVRLAYISMGATAMRSRAAEGALLGQALGTESIEAAAEATALDLSPLDDIHASAAYRTRLARVLTVRALTRATARASAG